MNGLLEEKDRYNRFLVRYLPYIVALTLVHLNTPANDVNDQIRSEV